MSRVRRWGSVLVLVAAALIAAVVVPSARADGDPGSDVLVYQDLFAGSDAGLSVAQQVELGGLLKATARAGAPVRVAIIASRFDLGAVTEPVAEPSRVCPVPGYRAVVGLQAAAAGGDAERLRVQLARPLARGDVPHAGSDPDPIRPAATGCSTPLRRPCGNCCKPSGVKLPSWNRHRWRRTVLTMARASRRATAPTTPWGSSRCPWWRSSASSWRGTGWLDAVGGRALVSRVACEHVLSFNRRQLALPGAALLLVMLAAVAVIVVRSNRGPAESQADALAKNPDLDPGTPVSGSAPDFTLSDQFGQPASLAFLPRQGGDPGVQRLGVHDGLPAYHDGDA